MRIRWVDARKPFVIALLCTVVVASCAVTFMTTAQAANLSWAHSDIHYTKVSDQALYTYPPTGYPNKTVMLGGLGGLRPERSAYISYFHERGAWAYGDYSYGGNEFPFVSSHGTAIRVGSDQNMYRVTPAFPHAVGDVPGTDDLIFPIDNPTSGFHFTYYKNFPSKLRHQTQTTGEVAYSYDQTPDFVLRRPNGTDISYSGAIGTSRNGKWAVLNAWGVGVVRINLETFEVKRISTQTYEYDPRRMPMSPEFAISNDGAHVAIIGRYVPLEVYDVSDTCGDKVTDAMTPATSIASPCPVRDITDLMIHNYGPAFETAYSPSFDDGGGQLTLYATAYGGQSPALWAQLTVDGYTPTPQLTYLALGDSYSSGEGDITDGNHYLAGTGGSGGCHISDRSYPFLLRDYYHIPTDEMKSIACSSAQVTFDYLQHGDTYRGQNGIAVKGKTQSARDEEREQALDNFKPGIVAQLDFVQKYKPKIVTLSGGGNDVGFATILRYCATPEKEDFVFTVDSTCGYAKHGSELNKMLYDSIDSQYGINKLLIDKIRQLSPATHIVLIGYPSFVAHYSDICGFNSAFLNDKELSMINDGVDYMDDMLSTLAHNENISYVDVRSTLVGGRICEPLGYVSGVWNVGVANVADGDPSLFHPNAAGHKKLAEAIEASGALAHEAVPGTTNYSAGKNVTPTFAQRFVAGGTAVVGQAFKVASGQYIFGGASKVDIKLFSDPVDLGTIVAAADGSVSTLINPRDVPPGEHVLVLTGTDPYGNPIKYYQFITIAEEDNTPSAVEHDPTQASKGEKSRVSKSTFRDDVPVENNDTNTSIVGSSINPTDSSIRAGHDFEKSNTAKRLIIAWSIVAGIVILIGGTAYVVYRKN